jgi:hypothetical protein
MQLAKKAAPAPKKVTPSSAAKRHSVVQSGCLCCRRGCRRRCTQVVPPEQAAICAFHITQPVELYQW